MGGTDPNVTTPSLTGDNPASAKEVCRLDRLVGLIAKSTPPPAWLRPGLVTAINALWWDMDAEGKHPHRAKLAKVLTIVRGAADYLTLQLKDKAVLAALEGPAPDNFHVVRDAAHSLMELRPLIDAALASIRPGKGPDKHYPQPVVTPLRMCAEFVCVAWQEARGRPVAHTSRDAQQACEQLWILAGGGARPHSSGDPSSTKGWREHLLAGKAELAKADSDYDKYKNLLAPTLAAKKPPR
jgi:hypothetical protein